MASDFLVIPSNPTLRSLSEDRWSPSAGMRWRNEAIAVLGRLCAGNARRRRPQKATNTLL